MEGAGPIEVFTLEGLAEREGTTYKYLLNLMYRLNKQGGPWEWRGYRFYKTRGGTWLAADCSVDLRVS